MPTLVCSYCVWRKTKDNNGEVRSLVASFKGNKESSWWSKKEWYWDRGKSHRENSEGQARKRGNIPSAPPTCIPFMNTWGTVRRPTSFCTAWWIAPPSSAKTRLVSFSWKSIEAKDHAIGDNYDSMSEIGGLQFSSTNLELLLTCWNLVHLLKTWASFGLNLLLNPGKRV